MIRYRVYTENVNYEATIELAKSMLPDSFTVFKAYGYWKGSSEKSIVFEVLCPTDDDRVTDFAYRVGKQNKQERVLVTRESDVSRFLV